MAFPFLTPKSLSFGAVISAIKEVFEGLPDQRKGKNGVYAMEDAALAAFSVFYTQSPSFLAHQRAMEKTKGRSNAQSLFEMALIPTDACIRKLLDPVDPQHIYPLFEQIFGALDAGGHIDAFRVKLDSSAPEADMLLIALDGTQYHQSADIHCHQCTKTEHRDGSVSYSHTMVSPVVVTPASNEVICLPPEFVAPQDGHAKQDCETMAAKRWLAAHGNRYAARGATFLGDDLYARQPLCEQVLASGGNFIFVCKPSSHGTVYEWINDLQRINAVPAHQVTWRKGRTVYTDTYRFVADVPLRDRDDALKVNWLELTTRDASGKETYHNAWITRHALDSDNVASIAEAGRARWKIENGANNVMKTKGYHLEHNFGHGEQHLASLFATFNLLAFLLHTFQGMVSEKYRLVREHLGTRTKFFHDIQALTTYWCFESFEALLDFMIKGLEIEVPDSS